MAMTLYRLKGCPAENINRIVRYSQYYGEHYHNIYIEHEIYNLSANVISRYTISDCIAIIISKGDIFDAMKKSEGIELNMNDKLIYHRQLVLPYVKEWLVNKVNEKIFLLKTKKNSDDRICSICFEEITNLTITITKCKHVFHRCCLNKWGKKTCPMCRNNI